LRLIATQVFAEIGSVKRRVSSPEMKMSRRTAKFVSAIFVSLLAGTPLATLSHGATEAAESCLSRPKGVPPAGGHWYYRIDRATKRSCWYLGDEKEKLSRAAPENSRPAVTPVASPNSASTPRSIADARAELPLPQTRVEQDASVFSGRRAPTLDTASLENSQRANAGDAGAQRSVVASRWMEPADKTSSVSPQPSAASSASKPQQISEAAPPPAAAPVALAAAHTPSSERPSSSVQMLLIAIVAALALASLLASAIFRFGATRRRRNIRVDRRTIWDSARTDRPSLADEARGAASMRDIGRPPEGSLPFGPRATDDPGARIAQMLARLPGTAAT
jgi:hypothetical protein